MKNQIIFPLLRSAYDNLTKAEKKIALYICQHHKTIMQQTVSDIAIHTHNSDITVSRFCKKLGFSGLQQLKLALASGSNPDISYQKITPNDDAMAISAKIFQNITDGLQDTLKLLDYHNVEAAINLIIQANRIAIYGFGNSYTICKDIETRFLRFGIIAQAYNDSHQQVTSASLLTSTDLVIAISHTGTSTELLESVEIAQKNKAKILAITSYTNSPLAKLADISLYGMGREIHYQSEAVASRLIHMAITDILYTGIAMKLDNYQSNIHKMRTAILKKRLK